MVQNGQFWLNRRQPVNILQNGTNLSGAWGITCTSILQNRVTVGFAVLAEVRTQDSKMNFSLSA